MQIISPYQRLIIPPIFKLIYDYNKDLFDFYFNKKINDFNLINNDINEKYYINKLYEISH